MDDERVHPFWLRGDREGYIQLAQKLFDDDDEEPELRCSLDRIDSTRHYEPGNLQVVCKFANSWKGIYDNDVFVHLIGKIRSNNEPKY